MKRYSVIVAVVWLVAALQVRADGFAVGAKVGTLGAGVEGTTWLAECLNLRVGANYLPFTYSLKQDDVTYDAKVTLESFDALLDWHCFNNNFRVSGGALYNLNGLRLDATPKEAKIVGDHSYTPTEIGTISGNVDFKKFAPYLGVGYGDAVEGDKRLSFIFDLGVMFQGKPTVKLRSTGTMANDPVFMSDLNDEENSLQDEASKFRFYPVISFGIAYQF